MSDEVSDIVMPRRVIRYCYRRNAAGNWDRRLWFRAISPRMRMWIWRLLDDGR